MAKWYAHSRPDAGPEHWEPLKAHLDAVAGKAGEFAASFDAGEWGAALGALHDLGKACPAFLRRLEGAREPVNHSSAGARTAIALYGRTVGRLLAYGVIGHHGGLPDGGELSGRLSDPFPDHDPAALGDMPEALTLARKMKGPLGPALLVRMLFSCLVDADFLATEAFYRHLDRGVPFDAAALSARLDAHLAGKAGDGEVNRLRAEVLARCRAMAAEPPGLFSLTVPTGGGKTLSSLAFALEHARRHESSHPRSRIVTVIPYTSIIEQTASEFRKALGDGVVVEHHSAHATRAEDAGDDARRKLLLAEENWDAPVVVTTAVQFFESLFAAVPSRCRKLHNLNNAVVVLDEAQLLPPPLLQPCLEALRALADNHGGTVVLCSATRPALDRSEWLKTGLDGVREIVADPTALHARLRRTRLEHAGEADDARLAEWMAAEDQVLTVVDTRDHARRLFDRIKEMEGARHLSAAMCPAHRARVLEDVREALRGGRPCRLVSTRLIEAGVDVDFPAVNRALAGLDSLIQAAGRCNREGRRPQGRVRVFTPPGGPDRRWLREANLARRVLAEKSDPMAPAAIEWYFRELYGSANLDQEEVMACLRAPDFDFREASRRFRMIEDDGVDVIVPWENEGKALVEDLRASDAPWTLLRRLQPYTVRVNPALAADSEILHDRFRVLVREERYHPEFGMGTIAPIPSSTRRKKHLV